LHRYRNPANLTCADIREKRKNCPQCHLAKFAKGKEMMGRIGGGGEYSSNNKRDGHFAVVAICQEDAIGWTLKQVRKNMLGWSNYSYSYKSQ
jgi:hypothetical protein